MTVLECLLIVGRKVFEIASCVAGMLSEHTHYYLSVALPFGFGKFIVIIFTVSYRIRM